MDLGWLHDAPEPPPRAHPREQSSGTIFSFGSLLYIWGASSVGGPQEGVEQQMGPNGPEVRRGARPKFGGNLPPKARIWTGIGETGSS